MCLRSLNKGRRTELPKSGRRGFILVPVLLLGVVFISCATAFAWFARLQVKNTLREKASLENRTMAHTLALSVVAGLRANTMVNYDSPHLMWFKPFFFPADDLGMWVVQVTPLDDRIPLRGLFLPDGTTLRTELRQAWTDMWANLQSRELENLVLDFLSRSTRPRMGGEQRETHINRYPVDISELLILEEMTPELLYGDRETGRLGVADYCTLWSGGRINLNVAPLHVIEILPGLDRNLAQRIEDFRDQQPIRTVSGLRDIPGFPARAAGGLMNLATVSSRYFLIRIDMLEDTGGGTSFNIVIDKTDGRIVHWEEI